jgi:hypothetical protein
MNCQILNERGKNIRIVAKHNVPGHSKFLIWCATANGASVAGSLAPRTRGQCKFNTSNSQTISSEFFPLFFLADFII